MRERRREQGFGLYGEGGGTRGEERREEREIED